MIITYHHIFSLKSANCVNEKASTLGGEYVCVGAAQETFDHQRGEWKFSSSHLIPFPLSLFRLSGFAQGTIRNKAGKSIHFLFSLLCGKSEESELILPGSSKHLFFR